MNAWVHYSLLKGIALKAIMVMPNLLLQNPCKESKTKDHIAALERRLYLCESGNILDLFKDAQTIQNGLKSVIKKKTIEEISKRFKEQIGKGNVNRAIKLLTNNMQHGILPLNDSTLEQLKQKHPQGVDPAKDILLPNETEVIHPIKFESINSELIRKVAIKARGGAGPSDIDADGWKRILTSNSFGESSTDLCKAFSEVIKKICIEKDQSISLETFLACRLIPLDKNPGLRPIGVGEILRCIACKVVVYVIREDIISSVGSLQVCAGHETACEAAIHAMHHIFEEEATYAVILIDASNAFNSINRKAFLHNISVVCPEIAVYVQNCYSILSRLFVIGGCEIPSHVKVPLKVTLSPWQYPQ